jgi:hypothetical protein
MLNFRYEDGFKIKNKYFPAISMVLYLSNKTIRRTPKSQETIPLTKDIFHRFSVLLVERFKKRENALFEYHNNLYVSQTGLGKKKLY